MNPKRVACVCGKTVLVINWENHLLRQDGKEHKRVSETRRVPGYSAQDEQDLKDKAERVIPYTPEDTRQFLEAHIGSILLLVGEDPQRSGIKETPARVARMWQEELLSGYSVDVLAIVKTFDDEGYDQVVAVKDIPFYSLCEHHMLPFKGVAHIGYLPAGRVLGVSKFARIVDAIASRLQIQERMTKQIAEVIQEGLKPRGVMVVIEAEHLCMTMRGVQKPNSMMVTSMVTGVFEEDASTKSEFLRLIGR